jgi:predicted ester cyclase
MTGIEIFRIENGKIAELWGEANLIGLMQQLGILPPLGA